MLAWSKPHLLYSYMAPYNWLFTKSLYTNMFIKLVCFGENLEFYMFVGVQYLEFVCLYRTQVCLGSDLRVRVSETHKQTEVVET